MKLAPVHSASGAAARYVPLILLTRGVAFLRFVLLAWLLGEAGRAEFWRYQVALEVINWTVPLMLLGWADVVERYAGQFALEGRLAAFFKRTLGRVALAGGAGLLVMLAAAPLLARVIFAEGSATFITIIILAGVNAVILAVYQWTAAALRGLRAYSDAAWIEGRAAGILLALSCLAAVQFGNASALLVAYGLSNLIPLGAYLLALRRHAPDVPAGTAPPTEWPRLSGFAIWSLLRLLLMMTFGLVALVAVGRLAGGDQTQGASYAMPYRVAQILVYVAAAFWGATYGIAAGEWARQARRRARVTLLRAGSFGGVALLLGAALLLIFQSDIAQMVPPAYRAPLQTFLPRMLALFIWYAMLSLLANLASLQERPAQGAVLWVIAVGLQITLILVYRGSHLPGEVVLLASAAGVGLAALPAGALLLWRPVRLSATAVPIGIVLLTPLAFFLPVWMVRVLGPLAVLMTIGFLWVAKLLIRPRERRALRRWKARRAQRRAAVEDSRNAPDPPQG